MSPTGFPYTARTNQSFRPDTVEKRASELAVLTVVCDERTTSLDPIDPDTALKLYPADRKSEVSQAMSTR